MGQIIPPSGGYKEKLATTGTTTNSYATARDIDMRGMESGVCTIENTGGTNSMDYKVVGEYADYSEGESNEIVSETAITAGNKDFFQLENAYARILVQVKSTSSGNHTTYSIDDFQNRL